MNTVATIEREQLPAATITTPAQMLAIAVQQGADLAKLEKLMDLQDRWAAAEAKKAYTAALAGFRAECPTIGRQQKGHNDRKYAGLADALDQVNGILAKHGLSHSWRTEQVNGQITVTCTVTHVGGHSEATALMAQPDTTGSKNAIQAVGSTVSYLQRYTLFAILGLASREVDDDGQAAGVSDDVSIIVDQILAAETWADVAKIMDPAWKANTSPAARKTLTAAKDQWKREHAQ